MLHTMGNGDKETSGRVVIVGGGVAGIEAMLALRDLAGDRLSLTLVAQSDTFVDRPMLPAEPFGLGSPARHSLAEVASRCGASFVQAIVHSVAAEAHRIGCEAGEPIEYDSLILAPGARMSAPYPRAIAFGTAGSGAAMQDLLGRLRSGQVPIAAFVAPSAAGWLLPLYELALMTGRALQLGGVDGTRLVLLTPEERPLALFGTAASDSIARLLSALGVEFSGSTNATVEDGRLVLGASGESVALDGVVTLPLLSGPELDGVPASQPGGFIAVDEHGRVHGLADVYAAGDATDFPVKQGGLAAQQADAVAAHIASLHGAATQAAPFRPVLRGALLTGGEPWFMRSDLSGGGSGDTDAWHPLWWPPTKVAGRYLPGFLLSSDEVEILGRPPAGFIDVDIPLTAATLPG
jgi:sulfide:quinone oxidoreductase